MKPNLLLTTAVVMCLAVAACQKRTETGTETTGTTTTTTTTDTGTTGTETAGETTTTTTPSDTATAPGGGYAPGETGMATGTYGNMTAADATPTTFVRRAVQTDMFEVEAAQAILAKSGISSSVRDFAQEMVAGHSATSTQLKSIAAEKSIAVPTALDADKRAMLDQLKSASAQQAVSLYLDQQVNAHQEALNLMQNCAANCDDSRLKEFAQNTAPAVQQHLTEVQQLRTATPSTNM